jgi:hypothetical protein
LILMANGTHKAATNVLPGDAVISYHEPGLPGSGRAAALAVDVVLATVEDKRARTREMVHLAPALCVTAGHPVLSADVRSCDSYGHPSAVSGGTATSSLPGVWMQPRQYFPTTTIPVPAVYNFVLQNRGALLVSKVAKPPSAVVPMTETHRTCEMVTTIRETYIACSTLGQFCQGVDEPSSFFGSDQVIQQLTRHSLWPAVVYS